ncbi:MULTISPECIES: alpha/beta fold hydrolase [unclassified Tolypothrix]|uniref:alpha/beta fold hydrolase n=1 Tax=unclassified Tolypothrix TaxID=2649714 RepID=UPI0005EAA78B|nr:MULTISPECIES: alpha/beta hydrolase [unclassified Tolypothrix]BAY91552.1 alpha/beta hydrolase fold protein [Microchaete diplosiphon NIES-3275]EKF05370.1 hydrolase, alpha/beta fold family protein [Tolypothrix sp. PCC 7601]MBE9083436.1 alpha/beta hydrolase [Tolypothrix sp. LEGE 11397]UYD25582.1 alpha/beta hydrolase [Tolypothrix sp. PCC 7712]UYD32177.1 alpha/beta hydrolase [Tolypothrix sp. PCC 7601]
MTAVVQPTWTHEYITTNGVRLHYVNQGEGPLMLMLHGFPEFWYSWRYQIPEFAKDFKVVALDLRGYNDSDKPEDKSAYVMAKFVKDVKGVIEGLGYEKCVLVGHDWGGAIAWNFAYTHPEMLDKLIILNLPHPAKFSQGLRNPQQMLKSSYMAFFQLPWLPEFAIQMGNYAPIEATFKGMAVDKNAFSQADIDAYKNAAAKPGALTAMLNYYRNIFDQKLLQENWGILQVPTLMIWGEDDTALGKELSYGTEAYVQYFQIKYIPHCSHWVQQEKPDLVNQYMRDFLSI